MALNLKIEDLHKAPEKGQLNQEWLVLINDGEKVFNGEGCFITVAKNATARPRVVTTLKAGLIVQPKEKVRLVAGSPGKKSQGDPPQEEGMRNFHLFLKAPFLDSPTVVIRLVKGQMELCQAVYNTTPS